MSDKTDVKIVMGSQSDWAVLSAAKSTLETLGVSCSAEVISAHRTPDRLFEFGSQAESQGHSVIIAGAGGAAHLPGMLASLTLLPVIGVPISLKNLSGLDSLLSIVQMPKGVPVATVAIDGAENAALLAAQILAVHNRDLRQRLAKFRSDQKAKVQSQTLD